MNSPQSKHRPWASESLGKTQQERKHLNKKFYNSKAWRDTRIAYLTYLKNKVWQSAADHVWTLPNAEIELTDAQSTYILSLDYIPCETCMKLFALDHRTYVREGKELDHINPLNPENALISKDYGSPFDHNNLQLLCSTHHARKSQRDKKIIERKQ